MISSMMQIFPAKPARPHLSNDLERPRRFNERWREVLYLGWSADAAPGLKLRGWASVAGTAACE